MPRIAIIVFLLGLTALTLWPRLTHLQDPIRFDEAANALYYADRGLLHAMFGNGGNENHTLNSVLVWASVQGLEWSEATIRLPALVAGTIYPFVLLILLGGVHGNTPPPPAKDSAPPEPVPLTAAWLAAIGAAVCPWLIFYSVNGRGYLLLTVCAALTVNQMSRFLTGDGARPWRAGVWAGCWSGLGALAVRSMLVVVAGLVLSCLAWLAWYGFNCCGKAIASRSSSRHISIWRAASPLLHRVTGSCSQAMVSRGPVARALPRFLAGWLAVAGAIPACWHAPQCLRLGWRGLVGVAPDLRLPPATAVAASMDNLAAAWRFAFANTGWCVTTLALLLMVVGIRAGRPQIRLAVLGGVAIVLAGLAAGAGAGLPVLSRQWLPLTACLLPAMATGAARILRSFPAVWTVGAAMALAASFLTLGANRPGRPWTEETGAIPAARALAAELPRQPDFAMSLVDLPPLLPVGTAFYWHEQQPDATRHLLGYDLRFDPTLLENARQLLLVLAPGDDAAQRLRELADREPRLRGRLPLTVATTGNPIGPYSVMLLPVRP